MFSEADCDGLKQRLAALSDKRNSLLDAIEKETQKNAILEMLRDEYQKMKTDFEKEEAANLMEIEKASLDVKKIKMNVPEKPITPDLLHDDKLENGENNLMKEIDKLEAVQNTVFALNDKISDLNKTDKEIDPILSDISVEVKYLEKSANKIPPISKLMMLIQNYESQILNSKADIRHIGEICSKQINAINEIMREIQNQSNQLKQLTIKLESSKSEAAYQKSRESEVLAEVRKIQACFDGISGRENDINADLYKEKSGVDFTIRERVDEKLALQRRFEELSGECKALVPAYAATEEDEARKLAKKRQLIGQIEDKIGEQRAEILRVQSSSPRVMALTDELGLVSVDVHRDQEECDAVERRLTNLKAERARKDEIFQEISILDAELGGAVDVGLPSMDRLFASAQSANRALAVELGSLVKQYEEAERRLK